MLLDEKASQNSPPAKAADNLNRFSPQHICGEKHYARRECFFARLWAKKRRSKRILLGKKANFLPNLSSPAAFAAGLLYVIAALIQSRRV